MKKSLFLILSILLCAHNSFGQSPYRSRKIKAEGDYIQNETNIVFPTEINNLKRKTITSFNSEKTNIGVSYEQVVDSRKTTVTIYIYPAGRATEDRLRNEYLHSLQSIANTNSSEGINATQTYCFYKKDGYKINGFKATINDPSLLSILEVYECGNWFMKMRITSNLLDSFAINTFDSVILNVFPFTNLVKKSSLNNNASIYINKTALRDSLILGCAIANTLAKSGWALDNIDSLERASGFPGLYLDMHMTAWRAFSEFQETHTNYNPTQYTIDYLQQINQLIQSQYLDEFLMKEYSMVMIVSDNKNFDFDGFDRWKLTHPITINLNERFSAIAYENKDK